MKQQIDEQLTERKLAANGTVRAQHCPLAGKKAVPAKGMNCASVRSTLS